MDAREAGDVLAILGDEGGDLRRVACEDCGLVSLTAQTEDVCESCAVTREMEARRRAFAEYLRRWEESERTRLHDLEQRAGVARSGWVTGNDLRRNR
jgi:hypothetical protein